MISPHNLRMALIWLREAEGVQEPRHRLHCVRATHRHVSALLKALEGKQ